MILIDANLLVYAHIRSFQQHESARAWLDGKLNGNTPVGIPWNSLLRFFGLSPILESFKNRRLCRTLGTRLRSGLIANWLGYRSPRNGIGKYLDPSSLVQECKQTWFRTPILPHWQSNMD